MHSYITIESQTPDRQPHIITVQNTSKEIAKHTAILKRKGHHNIKPHYTTPNK